jgi:hypothetical protein
MSELRTNRIVPRDGLPSGSSGGIIQIKQTVVTSTKSTTSTSFENISGLAVSITPTRADSKIMLMAQLSLSQENWVKRIHLLITGGNAATNYIGDDGTGVESALTICTRVNDGYAQMPAYLNYLDSPSTTSSVTYQVQWRVEANTGYLNRSHGGDSLSGLNASTITAMEVSG